MPNLLFDTFFIPLDLLHALFKIFENRPFFDHHVDLARPSQKTAQSQNANQ